MSLLRSAQRCNQLLQSSHHISDVRIYQCSILRHLSTTGPDQPPQEEQPSIVPIPQTPTSSLIIGGLLGICIQIKMQGPVYAKVVGINKLTLKTDIINLLESPNLTPENVKVAHNRAYNPVSMLLQFPSMSDYASAVRAIVKRGRVYKLEKTGEREWDTTKSYDGKYIFPSFPAWRDAFAWAMSRNSLLHLLRSPIRRTIPRPCKPILSQFYNQSRCITSFFRDKARPRRTHNDSNSKKKSAKKALRVLSLISHKTAPQSANEVRHAHLRLIEDFLHTHPEQPINAEPPTTDPEFESSDLSFDDIRVGPLERALDFSPVFETGNPIQLLLGLHREGLMRLSDTGLFAVSRSLGACVAAKDIHFGVQLHCLSIRCGFLQNVYVGTSLVSVYGKCGELGFACTLFDEMPERNIVSWSALISGFAQDWQVDVCFDLYIQMRQSGVQPNDYTLTALLSACMGSGSLGMGRNIHCQAIQLGFNSDVTVLNAIISLYCKCGDLHDASCVFNSMDNKDTISWNSIIAGYSLHGLALQTTELFQEMRRRDVKPDVITFLNVLSSCRHAGLVDQGRYYFNSMKECGVEPILDHYSYLVDLLGRAGLLEEAKDVVINMPMQPNAVVWGALLSCCSSHGNISIGIEAAKNRLTLNPGCPSTHVQLSNLYARLGKWDETARMRKIMKDRVLKTNPGCSWIEIGSSVYRFKADDTSNAKMMEVLDVLEILKDHLAVSDYVIETSEKILDCS